MAKREGYLQGEVKKGPDGPLFLAIDGWMVGHAQWNPSWSGSIPGG